MRKALLLLALIPCILSAQEVSDRSKLNLSLLRAPWAAASNAAGLAFSPLAEFNTLGVQYELQDGDARPMQTGTRVSDIRFDTQGSRQIGKMQVWGRFRYDNISDTGSSFNTLLYDPFDERFMYTAADTVAGKWKKQSYDMQFKAAMPISESFAAGLHVRYTDRIAAAQIDPRAESYHYCVNVKPSLVWKVGSSTVGLSGQYANTFERSTPSISNSQEIQKVFLMRGLGNWVGEQVGGSGLGTMYFRCNTWGGALQYGFKGGCDLFSELSWAHHSTAVTESPTQPKPHGSTVRNEYALRSGAILENGVTLHRIALDASLSFTRGIEPTAMWNTATGCWEVQAELEQCLLRTAGATLAYHLYRLEEARYRAHWYAELGFEDKADSYATPASVFAYDNVLAAVGTERRFALGHGSLLAGATVKGAKNVHAEYSYTGHRAGTAPVRELYPHNLAVFAADRIQGTISAEYAFPVSSGASLAFCLEGSGTASFSKDYGTLHRLAVLAAVKLYF